MGINLNDLGYQDTRAAVKGTYELLQPDAYTCVILHADLSTSQADNPILVLYIDICEGEYSGYFKRFIDYGSTQPFFDQRKWRKAGICRQIISNNGRLSPYFKGLLECIEISNSGYHININNFEPAELIGKRCGFVFGENEYRKKDGTIGIGVYIAQPVTTIDVANGNYKIPPLKKLDDKDKPQPQPAKKSADDYYYNTSAIDDSDVPF